MFIGDRRTTHAIRAFRSPALMVIIPKGAMLHDVRTGVGIGWYRFHPALRVLARTDPNLHIFEYRGETLYAHFVAELLEATTEVDRE